MRSSDRASTELASPSLSSSQQKCTELSTAGLGGGAGNEQLKYCVGILRELMSKKYSVSSSFTTRELMSKKYSVSSSF